MNHASYFPRPTFVRVSFLHILILLALASSAAADPIVIRITSGFIEKVVQEGAPGADTRITLTGPDFNLDASGAGSTGAPCEPCEAGTAIFAAGSFGPHFGNFTYQGTTYEFDLFSGVSALGQFDLKSSNQFALPETAADRLIFQSPFTVAPSSFVTGRDFQGVPLVTLSFTGGGIATLTLRPERFLDRTSYFLESARYDFTDPIPEPATVVLLASGMATLSLRRRRSSSRQTAKNAIRSGNGDPRCG